MVAWVIRLLPRVAAWSKRVLPRHAATVLVGVAFSMIVVTHLLQIAIWSIVLAWLGAIDGAEPAIYFSLVTYTTLGYGDITLDEGTRLFASFASITGLLTFGLSTALLVGLFGRLIAEETD